jgi:hypothetical protein
MVIENPVPALGRDRRSMLKSEGGKGLSREKPGTLTGFFIGQFAGGRKPVSVPGFHGCYARSFP